MEWIIPRKEIAMASLHILMPDPMKQWVDGQAHSGRYADASDYVRDLIRRDQERLGKIEAMQRLVDGSLASGLSDESMSDILHSIHNAAE
jgi:antitoxin ParD1/3/4